LYQLIYSRVSNKSRVVLNVLCYSTCHCWINYHLSWIITSIGNNLVKKWWKDVANMNIYRIYFKWLTIIVLQSYGVTLYMYRTPYLVDIVRENIGKVLNLNSIEAGNAWKGMDMLIFNSWHWWVHTGRSQGYFFPPFACPASTCAVVLSSFYVCLCVCVSTFIWNSGFIAATIGCANADGTTSGMDQHCTKIWTDWRHSVKD